MAVWIDYRHCDQPYIAERGIGRYASLAGVYLTPRTYLRSYRIAVNGLRAAVLRSIEGRSAGGAT